MIKRAISSLGKTFLGLKEPGFTFMLAGLLFASCSCSGHEEKTENRAAPKKTSEVRKAEESPVRGPADAARYSMLNQNSIGKSSCISWSHSGESLAFGSALGTVTVFDRLRDEVTSVLRLPFNYLFEEDGSRREVLGISWNKTEDKIAVSYDGLVAITWDLKEDSILRIYRNARFINFVGGKNSVVYIEQKDDSPGSSIVAKDIEKEGAIVEHSLESNTTALGKSIEGDHFFRLRDDGGVEIWDSKYYKRIKTLEIPEGIHEILEYSDRTQTMIVKNDDYQIRVMDVDKGGLVASLKGDDLLASCLVRNGGIVFIAYSAPNDRVGYSLYDTKKGKRVADFRGAFDSGIKLLACGTKTNNIGYVTNDNNIVLLDSYHNKVLKKFSSTDREIDSLIFEGGRIITGGSVPKDGLYPGGELQIWKVDDIPFIPEKASSRRFEYRVTSMDTGKDGRRLSVRAGTFAQDYSFDNGVMREKPLESGGPYVFAVELDKDEKYIVTRSKYGAGEPLLEVHDAKKKKRLFGMPASGAVDVLKKGFMCGQKKMFVSYYREATGNQKIMIVDHGNRQHREKAADEMTQGVEYLRWSPDCEELLLSNRWGETLLVPVEDSKDAKGVKDYLYREPQDLGILDVAWSKTGKRILYLRSDMAMIEWDIEARTVSEVAPNQISDKYIWYQDRKAVMDTTGRYLIYGSENGYTITRMTDKKSLYVDIMTDGKREHVLIYDDDGNYTGDEINGAYAKVKMIRPRVKDVEIVDVDNVPVKKQMKNIVSRFMGASASRVESEGTGHRALQLDRQ